MNIFEIGFLDDYHGIRILENVDNCVVLSYGNGRGCSFAQVKLDIKHFRNKVRQSTRQFQLFQQTIQLLHTQTEV